MKLLRERLINLWINTNRSLKLVWESSKTWTSAAVLIVILQGLVPVILLALMGGTIDTLTAVFEGQGQASDVIPFLVLFAGVSFFDIALSQGASIIREGQVLAVVDRVTKVIHDKSISVDLDYYENSEYHNTLHRAQREAPSRPPMIVDNLLSAAQNLILTIGIVGLLGTANPVIVILLIVSTLPIVFFRLYFSHTLYEWQKRTASSERRLQYFNMILTAEWFAKELRLFNTGPIFGARYSNLRTQLRTERMALVFRRARLELLVQSVTVAALFIAFGLAINDAVSRAITIGQLVITFQAFQRGQGALKSLFSSLSSLYENNLFLQDFYQFVEIEQRIQAPAQPQAIPRPFQQGIRFENVAFRYSHGYRTVLKNINLDIKPGEVVALVGENGAGKTTLIKLLCRLYDPTEGCITLDGQDLRSFDPIELRKAITVMFQDFNVYQLSALENIWLGDTKTEPDMEKIQLAAWQSGADAVIQKLSHGYDTQLGNQFEGGNELSHGQWQKVALARAFMRDAQLIVLDEPTSALDVITESEIFERFRNIIAGKSAILISHRLSTIQMADRIFVLDDGNIIESGSHDELMHLDGHYANLYRTQAKFYT